jgi:hypothetical protein
VSDSAVELLGRVAGREPKPKLPIALSEGWAFFPSGPIALRFIAAGPGAELPKLVGNDVRSRDIVVFSSSPSLAPESSLFPVASDRQRSEAAPCGINRRSLSLASALILLRSPPPSQGTLQLLPSPSFRQAQNLRREGPLVRNDFGLRRDSDARARFSCFSSPMRSSKDDCEPPPLRAGRCLVVVRDPR